MVEQRIVPIENDSAYKDEIVMIDDVSIDYRQNGDCTQDGADVQTITIKTENNGTTRFIVLSTSRWSISGIDDLIGILNDFKARAGL